MPDLLLGALLAFCIAVVTTPSGVSGAVFLLPVQVSILHIPSPAVTPTNLLYNVVATPGALARFRREGRLGSPLTKLMLAGTIPGVTVGAVVRVELVPGPEAFLLVIAAVLLPLGAWLAIAPEPEPREDCPDRPAGAGVVALAMGVGAIGGVYGIGGGSILGPLLVARGYPLRLVAPAALTATFVTSIAGAVAFGALSLGDGGHIAPNWLLGVALGLGGLAGGYLGARLQRHVPERLLRRLLGVIAVVVAVRYLLIAA